MSYPNWNQCYNPCYGPDQCNPCDPCNQYNPCNPCDPCGSIKKKKCKKEKCKNGCKCKPKPPSNEFKFCSYTGPGFFRVCNNNQISLLNTVGGGITLMLPYVCGTDSATQVIKVGATGATITVLSGNYQIEVPGGPIPSGVNMVLIPGVPGTSYTFRFICQLYTWIITANTF